MTEPESTNAELMTKAASFLTAISIIRSFGIHSSFGIGHWLLLFV